MCGIFAVYSRRDFGFMDKEKLKTLVQSLALMTQVRGTDAFGGFTVLKNGEALFYKEKYCSSYSANTNEWRALVDKCFATGRAIVGHCRAATVGNLEVEGAHPHQVGSTLLVHNGTLRQGWRKWIVDDKHDTDSLCLTRAIDEKGLAAFEDISGAYACIWHDAKTNTLKIARNTERPLVVYQDSDYLIVSSELAILLASLMRAGIKHTEGSFVEVASNVCYSLDIKSPKMLPETPIPFPKIQYTASNYYSSESYEPTSTKRQPSKKGKSSFGKVVLFSLYEKEEYAGHIKYVGLTEKTNTEPGNDEIRFYVKKEEAEFSLEKKYTGEVTSYSKKTGFWIKSETVEEVLTTNSEDSDNVQFLNKSLSKNRAKAVTSCPCSICGDFINDKDLADTYVLDNNTPVCGGCIDYGTAQYGSIEGYLKLFM